MLSSFPSYRRNATSFEKEAGFAHYEFGHRMAKNCHLNQSSSERPDFRHPLTAPKQNVTKRLWKKSCWRAALQIKELVADPV